MGRETTVLPHEPLALLNVWSYVCLSQRSVKSDFWKLIWLWWKWSGNFQGQEDPLIWTDVSSSLPCDEATHTSPFEKGNQWLSIVTGWGWGVVEKDPAVHTCHKDGPNPPPPPHPPTPVQFCQVTRSRKLLSLLHRATKREWVVLIMRADNCLSQREPGPPKSFKLQL